MKLCLLEIHNKLSPRLQPWFRETREATFQTTLEDVSAHLFWTMRSPVSPWVALLLRRCTAPAVSTRSSAPLKPMLQCPKSVATSYAYLLLCAHLESGWQTLGTDVSLHGRKVRMSICTSTACLAFQKLANSCWIVQFVANDSNRDQVIADFRAALDPVRATLKEYPWLGGAAGPKYSDIYLMAFFMVRSSPSPSQTCRSYVIADMHAIACAPLHCPHHHPHKHGLSGVLNAGRVCMRAVSVRDQPFEAAGGERSHP